MRKLACGSVWLAGRGGTGWFRRGRAVDGGDANGQVDVFERAIPANINRVFEAGFE